MLKLSRLQRKSIWADGEVNFDHLILMEMDFQKSKAAGAQIHLKQTNLHTPGIKHSAFIASVKASSAKPGTL